MSDITQTPVDYRVTKAREIAGLYRQEGETISMLPAQAKYYLAPNGEGLELPGPRKETVGSLDDPLVKNPNKHATGKPGKSKTGG